MNFLKILVWIWFAIGSSYWLLQFLFAVHAVMDIPLLKDLEDNVLAEWPKVSVIICANNEAETIEEAIKLRLVDDYPNVEYILVDDRSTDGTSEIIDALEEQDRRVVAVHINELPEGWLGKVHAMHQGVKLVKGDWLLFSDADVFVRKGTLKRVVSFGETKGIDLVSIIPQFQHTSFFVDTAFSMYLRLVDLGENLLALKDKREPPVGSGSFNMVRRTAFEKTRGLEWLKLDVVEDFTLPQMLNDAGATTKLINGRGFVNVRLLDSFKGAASLMERALFAALGDFKLAKIALLSIILFVYEMSPFIAFIPVGNRYLPFAGVALVIVALVVCFHASARLNFPIGTSLLFPLGATFVCFLIVFAGVSGKRRGGLMWRGTLYPTAQLKASRKFRLMSGS